MQISPKNSASSSSRYLHHFNDPSPQSIYQRPPPSPFSPPLPAIQSAIFLSNSNSVVYTRLKVQAFFFSAIGAAIEGEEYRKETTEVLRKGFELEGYSVERISIGEHETCVIIPELKAAFDIGRCPSRAVHQNFLFITHGHLDHIGYIVYSIRKKLKKQYIHLNGKQIEKLKKSGVEITDMILSPEIAFTGDTTSDFMLEPCNADALRAKLLIMEATFLDDGFSIEDACEHGHTHLFELIENAHWIRNKAVLLKHFSSRYHLEDIHKAVSKLSTKVSAKVVLLTKGFRSIYS